MQCRTTPVAILSVFLSFTTAPASAGGEILITQAKALAGNVTPGDTAGYPITISQPGAYVLESNLAVTPGTYGLFVTANNVDIDMNGFTLSGTGGGTYGLISGHGESSIHDGIVSAFRYSGIYLRGNFWSIENVKIVRNGGHGIDAGGAAFISVVDSFITLNRGGGLVTSDSSSFHNNTISRNSGNGISCSIACNVDGNMISGNVVGVETDVGTIIGNTIAGNSSLAVLTSSATGIGQNTFYSNNSGGLGQTSGGKPLQPNACSGLPCSVP